MKKKKLFVSIMAGILAAAMVLGFLAAIVPHARAASSGELQSQLEELEARNTELQEQMDALEVQKGENQGEIEQVVAEKSNIDQQISLLFAQIETLNQQISTYSLMIADKQEELDAAEKHLQELNEKNKERIRSMEEGGALSYWSVIFEASSFFDLLDRLNMIEEIAAADKRRLEEMSAVARSVAEAREELVAQKTELERTGEELEASQKNLSEKRKQADNLMKDLISRGEEYQALLEEHRAKAQSLMEEIAQKEQEYSEAKAREWAEHMATATTAPPPTQATRPNNPTEATEPDEPYIPPTDSGDWMVPCSYVFVSSPFGYREGGEFHNGIDLAAYEGTPIYASRSGVVTASSYDIYNGYHVFLSHGDGYSSYYIHMQYQAVSEGEYVSQGQVIGYVGNTGASQGAHLHFTIRKDGAAVNPADYMSF